MKIDDNTVRDVEELARLALDAQTRDKMIAHLQTMVDYVARLEELDLGDVEPLFFGGSGEATLAEDVPQPSIPVEDATVNAPHSEANLFVVPPVIEGGTSRESRHSE